jgi:hypothetical protein
MASDDNRGDGGADDAQDPSPASPPTRRPAPAPTIALSAPQPVHDAAGFLLALVLWGWVILPFVEAGPYGVKKVIKAKFMNQTADGKWLP